MIMISTHRAMPTLFYKRARPQFESFRGLNFMSTVRDREETFSRRGVELRSSTAHRWLAGDTKEGSGTVPSPE